MIPLRWGLALSGWSALAAAVFLPEASALRVLVTTVFLLGCPGLAATRWARPSSLRLREADRTVLLETAVLALVLSASLSVLVAGFLFLSGMFTTTRALLGLAVVTSVLALLPRPGGRWRRAPRAAPDDGPPADDSGRARRHAPERRTGSPEPVARPIMREPRITSSAPGPGSAYWPRPDPCDRLPAAITGAGGVFTHRRTWRVLAASVLVLGAACGGGDRTAPQPSFAEHWKMVFHDEFDGTKLNTDRWATCYDWNREGCTNSGNNEEQWYLPGQVSVGGGVLTMSADRRATSGSDGRTYPWVSGMLSTGRDHWDARPRRTFTYGYFEAAVRIPAQGGMFPAVWMMPASRTTPPELDIMEFRDSIRQVTMYTHWRDSDGTHQTVGGSYGPVDFPADYHVFGLLWEAHELTWYVDGVRRFRVTEPERIPHVPMEVLFTLAVGVPHSPPRSVDSAQMKVDWVRVWQQ